MCNEGMVLDLENSSRINPSHTTLVVEFSKSNTIPSLHIENNDVDAAHEARVGKISEESIFYLQSRGLSEEQAVKMIISGFLEPIVKQLPLEYAVELNKLIELEMESK